MLYAFRFYYIFLAVSLISALSPDDVLWSSPSKGSVYHSGDTLTAAWKPSLNKGDGSPSFNLCDQGDGCGDAVWPAVRTRDDGFKEASFVIPNVTSGATFHLRMEDDFENTSASPEFTLSPLPSKGQAEPESSLVAPVDGPAQLPLSGLASSEPIPHQAPFPATPPSDQDLGSWGSVPALESSSTIDLTSPATFPSSQRPWFDGASVFPNLPTGPSSGNVPVPEQQPDEPRDHVEPSSLNPSFPSEDLPSPIVGKAAVAPPMSQVHFPPSSDTTPTPLAPHSQLSVTTHSTPLPIAAIAVPLSFAAVIGIVAFTAIAYNRRKASRNEAQRAAAVSAINGNIKLLEARDTSFWSRSSSYSSGPTTPTGGVDQEQKSVIGRLTARWMAPAPPPDVHEDLTQQQDGQVNDLAALPSQKFDEILLSPAIPPPLHIHNSATMDVISSFTTSSANSVSPVDSRTATSAGGLYHAVSKAFGGRQH